MAWRVVVVSGEAIPRLLEVPEDAEVVVGRDPGCDLRAGSSKVSRRHAALRCQGGELRVEDLRSSTGLMVNGRLVDSARLAAGDTLEVSDLVLRIEGEATPPAAEGAEGLLEALAELLADADADGGLDAVLDRTLARLVEAFASDRAMVFAPGAGTLVRVAMRVAPDSPVGPDDPVSRGLLESVARSGTARLTTSLETDELRSEHESIPGTLRSLLAVPLSGGERPGVLYLDSALERRRFGDRDRTLLVAFGRALGLALAREEARRNEQGRSQRLVEIQRRVDSANRLIGKSPGMLRVGEEIAQAAAADVTVLVTGESGTGKELVARALHRQSARRDHGFVAVNCAAIPAELVESELFGHERGAFTGAEARRIGCFELAHGGTLFLDEIGELPAGVQGKLLRALQERTIRRLGGNQDLPVDFRLVSATHVDLKNAIRSGRFREDLFYRIAVFPIALPPLRDRGGDIAELAGTFLAGFSRELGRDLQGFEPDALRALERHSWPGNIRELRNVIEQAVVRERSRRVTLASLAPALGVMASRVEPAVPAPAGPPPGPEWFRGPIEDARRAFEKAYLEHQLEANQGNMKATAEASGLARRSLYDKCQELAIDYSRFRGSGSNRED